MFIFETFVLLSDISLSSRACAVLANDTRYELIRSKLAIDDSQKILAEIQ